MIQSLLHNAHRNTHVSATVMLADGCVWNGPVQSYQRLDENVIQLSVWNTWMAVLSEHAVSVYESGFGANVGMVGKIIMQEQGIILVAMQWGEQGRLAILTDTHEIMLLEVKRLGKIVDVQAECNDSVVLDAPVLNRLEIKIAHKLKVDGEVGWCGNVLFN